MTGTTLLLSALIHALYDVICMHFGNRQWGFLPTLALVYKKYMNKITGLVYAIKRGLCMYLKELQL